MDRLRNKLGIAPPFPPMEARLVRDLPIGREWVYEPKWDGFRCMVFRDGVHVGLQSKSCKPLGRYFPEMEAAMLALTDEAFVMDGELVSMAAGRPSFETLQKRLHPAGSRVEMLARTQPATFIAFDLLAHGTALLLDRPLSVRKEALERFARSFGDDRIVLSPVTGDARAARGWLAAAGNGTDGVVAKRINCSYARLRRKPVGVARCEPATRGRLRALRGTREPRPRRRACRRRRAPRACEA